MNDDLHKEKLNHVLSAKQIREHECHWPGCKIQVPPARWGCGRHWFSLPLRYRLALLEVYEVGQEERMDPSPEYLTVAKEVQEWIREHYEDENS